MSLSPVTICNMALNNIGTRSNIANLMEASAEAAACNLWYDYARKQTLEAYDWNFARKRIDLALDGDDPPFEWAFRYQYPADCLRARRIVNPAGEYADAVPFDIETNTNGQKTILLNLQTPTLVYTFDQIQSDLFEPLFVKALGHLIASYIAYGLTSKEEIMNTQYQLYNQSLGLAGQTNANEQVGRHPREPDWIRYRN